MPFVTSNFDSLSLFFLPHTKHDEVRLNPAEQHDLVYISKSNQILSWINIISYIRIWFLSMKKTTSLSMIFNSGATFI